MISQFRQNFFTHKQRALRPLIFLGILLAWLVAACGAASSQPELRPVTVQLSWYHYANFAGFYMAEQTGLYQDNAIEIHFEEAGPQTDYIKPVLEKQAQFGVMSAEALMSAQSQGLPLVAIGAIQQDNPAVLVAKQAHGISTPSDLIGRRIRITNQVLPIVAAFLADNNVPSDRVELVNLPSTIDAFDADEATVWTIYINSFAVALEEEGYQLDYLYPDDYGVHFLGEVIVVHEDLITNEPALIQDFIDATIDGYRMAIEQAERVGGLVKQYDPSVDEELETAKWYRTIPLILPVRHPLGWIDGAQWEEMQQELIDHSGLDPAAFETEGYSNQFIDRQPADLLEQTQ